jgi:DNA-binding transcriptional LysR family regulator
LSRSIQALEDDLGGMLVDRVGKKNELTPLGRSVLERARRIVDEAQELRQGATLLQQGGLGALRVGLGSGPGAMLMTPWLVYMAKHHPTVQVTVSRGSTELQLTQLRERQLDALVVDVRRVEAAPDLKITHVVEMRAGFVCRQGHPLLSLHPKDVPFEALLAFPIASIQLSQEVARLLVDHYGPRANPAQMTTLQCEDIASLLDVVGQTDAIYLGIVGAARQGIAQGRLVELGMGTPLQGQARLALITLAGRTELPVMSVFRDFVQKHLTD